MEPMTTRLYYEQLLQEALGLPTIKHTLTMAQGETHPLSVKPTEYRCGNRNPTIALNQNLDVILVCIDFENGGQIRSHFKSGCMGRKKKAQAGVSIFDTRTLSLPSIKEALQTYNIGLGGSPSSKKRIDRRFIFGETNWIFPLANLLDSIEELVDRTRNIILVGHGFSSDLHVLQSIGFDLETSVVGILDTEAMARTIFGPSDTRGGLRLKNILAKLNCPVERCHIAGNDANFTLRALLLLVAEGYSGLEDSLNDKARERLEKIKAIGHSPLLCLSAPPTCTADKNEIEPS